MSWAYTISLILYEDFSVTRPVWKTELAVCAFAGEGSNSARTASIAKRCMARSLNPECPNSRLGSLSQKRRGRPGFSPRMDSQGGAFIEVLLVLFCPTVHRYHHLPAGMFSRLHSTKRIT